MRRERRAVPRRQLHQMGIVAEECPRCRDRRRPKRRQQKTPRPGSWAQEETEQWSAIPARPHTLTSHELRCTISRVTCPHDDGFMATGDRPYFRTDRRAHAIPQIGHFAEAPSDCVRSAIDGRREKPLRGEPDFPPRHSNRLMATRFRPLAQERTRLWIRGRGATPRLQIYAPLIPSRLLRPCESVSAPASVRVTGECCRASSRGFRASCCAACSGPGTGACASPRG